MKIDGVRKVVACFLAFILFTITFSGLTSISKTVIAQEEMVEMEFEATLTTTPAEKPVKITVKHKNTNDGFSVMRGEPPFSIEISIADESPDLKPCVRLTLWLISPSGRILKGGGGYLGESAMSIYRGIGASWILTGEDVEEQVAVGGTRGGRYHAENGAYTFLIQQTLGGNNTDVLSPICSIEVEMIEEDGDGLADEVHITDLNPPVGSILTLGEEVSFEATVSYTLASEETGFIELKITNDQNKILIGSSDLRSIGQGSDSIWLTVTCTIPWDATEINVYALLSPLGATSTSISWVELFEVVRGREKPIAVISVWPEDPSEGDVVWVDGISSSDPDGGAITLCTWSVDWRHDNSHRDDLGPWILQTPGEAGLSQGLHWLSLSVTDNEGDVSETVTKTIFVKPSSPEFKITEFKVNFPPPVLSVTISIVDAETNEPITVPVKIKVDGDITKYLDSAPNVKWESPETPFVETSTGNTGTVTIPLGLIHLSKLSSSDGLSALQGTVELYVSKLGFGIGEITDAYDTKIFNLPHIAEIKSTYGDSWLGSRNQRGTKTSSGLTLKPGDKLTIGGDSGVHWLVLNYIDGSIVKLELPAARDETYVEFFIGRTKTLSDLPPSYNTQQLMWIEKNALILGAKVILKNVIGKSSFIIGPLADPEALGQGLVIVKLNSAVLVEGQGDDSLIIRSLEGSPEVIYNQGEDSFVLDAGMMTLLSGDQPPTAPTSFDLASVLDELGDLSELGILPSEVTLRATLVDVDYPSEAYVGESLNVELTVDYEFTEPTKVGPGIFDVVADKWLAEPSEILEGNGSRIFYFELTAPSEEMDWALQASVWYISEGDWRHDDANYVESFVIQVIELDENGGGIPGFPIEAIIIGLLIGFSLLSRRASLQI